LFEVQDCFVRLLFFSCAEAAKGWKRSLTFMSKGNTLSPDSWCLWYCIYFFLCSLKKKRTMGSTNLCLLVYQVQVPNHWPFFSKNNLESHS
jgi:hypothetical protein